MNKGASFHPVKGMLGSFVGIYATAALTKLIASVEIMKRLVVVYVGGEPVYKQSQVFVKPSSKHLRLLFIYLSTEILLVRHVIKANFQRGVLCSARNINTHPCSLILMCCQASGNNWISGNI